METSARLYTLNYNEAKTYMWAAIFVACNLVLPVMAFKLAVLALIAGFTAQHFRKTGRRTWRTGTDGRHRSHHSGLYHRLARTTSASLRCVYRLQVLIKAK